jgi:hypothetical protein
LEQLIPIALFSRAGNVLSGAVFACAMLLALTGVMHLRRPQAGLDRFAGPLFIALILMTGVGFAWICWFHLQVYLQLPLELPARAADLLNRQLEIMNRGKPYGLPLYDPDSPPRYLLPLWLENEKYFFWFLCYAVMALVGHCRLRHPGFRAALSLLLAVQAGIVHWGANPFFQPLSKFFAEVGPWFTQDMTAFQRLSLFMQLYPRMQFYYNAEYMWFHPPLLFLSYACITMTFVTSVLMLAKREPEVEGLGYAYAKLGFFLLTLGMLLGYPWALKAWGPNWWWDPKICTSIMMWAVYSTYLHTRLYANKPFMWYFSSLLGILCFLAMLFTFVSSYFFPGEHTFV